MQTPLISLHPVGWSRSLGHGDEGPAAADTQVGAELDGARQERPGAGPCHQVEHLRHIGRTEADGLRIRGCCHPVVDELDALRAEGDLPIAGRRLTQRGEGDGPSGAA